MHAVTVAGTLNIRLHYKQGTYTPNKKMPMRDHAVASHAGLALGGYAPRKNIAKSVYSGFKCCTATKKPTNAAATQKHTPHRNNNATTTLKYSSQNALS